MKNGNDQEHTEKPVQIAEGVWWVGFSNPEEKLHCNPYLVVDGDEAVLIDGGSRPDFPTVAMKILQTGTRPNQIRALVYQHYDPDLCSSIPDLQELIGRKDLKLISHRSNVGFIRHYFSFTEITGFDSNRSEFTFSSGRTLSFHLTPYCHSPGSFVTYDEKTQTLFTSDIFGSYGEKWNLFLQLDEGCLECIPHHDCPNGKSECPMAGILRFHQVIMTSNKALRGALRTIASIPKKIVAPQHGSVIREQWQIEGITSRLARMSRVGIDGLFDDEFTPLPDQEMIF